jgi:hypothetical protein
VRLEQRPERRRVAGADRRLGLLPGQLAREPAVVRVARPVGRLGELVPGAEPVLVRQADAGIGQRRVRRQGAVVEVGEPGDPPSQAQHGVGASAAGSLQQAVGPVLVLLVPEGPDAIDRPDGARLLLLRLALEGGPGAMPVLLRDDVQRVGQHEARVDAVAEGGAGTLHGRLVAGADGAQQGASVVPVAFDALRPQLVVQFLVHGSSAGPAVRLPGPGGARTARWRFDEQRGGSGPVRGLEAPSRARGSVARVVG